MVPRAGGLQRNIKSDLGQPMTPSQFETCKTERISLITGTAFLYSSVLVAKKTRRCHRVAKLNLLCSDYHQALIKSVLMQNTWSLLLAEFTSDVVCHLKKRTKRMNPKHKETTIINENLDFWQLNVSKWTTQCYQTFHEICIQIWIDFLDSNDVLTGIRWSRMRTTPEALTG